MEHIIHLTGEDYISLHQTADLLIEQGHEFMACYSERRFPIFGKTTYHIVLFWSKELYTKQLYKYIHNQDFEMAAVIRDEMNILFA